jgi:hypothetical protein
MDAEIQSRWRQTKVSFLFQQHVFDDRTKHTVFNIYIVIYIEEGVLRIYSFLFFVFIIGGGGDYEC